jgi:hypothetical protein
MNEAAERKPEPTPERVTVHKLQPIRSVTCASLEHSDSMTGMQSRCGGLKGQRPACTVPGNDAIEVLVQQFRGRASIQSQQNGGVARSCSIFYLPQSARC